MIKDNTPIIVGVGQYVSRETPTAEKFLSALDIAGEAGRRAINDARATVDLGAQIEVMAVSRLFEDSTRKVAIVSNPFGGSNNVPGSIARRIGIKPRENIYCAEVETVIYNLDGIAECSVFGVEDDRLGEEVGAAIVCKDAAELSIDQIRAHCLENMAKPKVPRYIWILNEPLPRNANGKFLKRELRETLDVDDAG